LAKRVLAKCEWLCDILAKIKTHGVLYVNVLGECL